jgi:hypothetical protein
MAHTEDLLRLVSEFPRAFADPEENKHLQSELERIPQTQNQDSITDTKTQQLLQLITEFPVAFADPEAPDDSQSESLMPLDSVSPATSESSVEPVAASHTAVEGVPAGYTYALRRRVQTLTWGQVDFHLVYGGNGLEEIWLTVGKSGTEVQSLGEATCRLINLLLLNGVPIPKIVREIRGIRGADSEGLGPNRILGLADLIGKVLQEAPEQYGTAQAFHLERRITDSSASIPQVESVSAPTPQPVEAMHELPMLSQISSAATAGSALCPECGAELQQINGCKGGACVVCGYSSCS